MKNYRLMVVLTFVLLAAACGGGGSGETPQVQPVTYTYSTPAQTNDGWATGHLVDHGFDVALITEMMEGIRSGRFSGLDSVTIVRNNTLLLHAAYRSSVGRFDDWIGNTDPERHAMMSTSKTVTSALIGIAIDQGFIASVTVPFYDLFAYGNYSNPDARKTTMTLEDALTMRFGLQWDEWALPYGTPGNDLEVLMSGSTDYAKALQNAVGGPVHLSIGMSTSTGPGPVAMDTSGGLAGLLTKASLSKRGRRADMAVRILSVFRR